MLGVGWLLSIRCAGFERGRGRGYLALWREWLGAVTGIGAAALLLLLFFVQEEDSCE